MTDKDERAELSAAAAGDVRLVVRGGGVQIGGQVASRTLSLVFQSVAIRLLERTLYGLYREIAQILTIAGQMGLLGFNYASVRFIARARAARDHGGVRGTARVTLVGAALASLLVMVVLVAAADVVAGAFVDEGDDPASIARLLRLGAPYIPLFALMQVLRYCTQAYKTMVPSVVVGTLVQPGARYLLALAALVAGMGVAGAVGAMVVGTALGTAAGVFYLRRMLTEAERAAAPSAAVGPIVRFALPQAGSALLSVQDMGYGIVVLGLLSDHAEVALFGIALALQGPGSLFLSGVVNIWAPVVTELHTTGQIERLGSLYQTINRWVATFSFPVFAALILAGDVFAELYGNLTEPRAWHVVAVLAAGNFFYTGTGPSGYLLSMTGHPHVNLFNSVAGLGAYVGLGFLAVPRYGAVGMAVVDAVITAALNLVRVVEGKILIGVQPFGRTFYKPVVATLVASSAFLAWRLVIGDGSAWTIVAGLVPAGIVYAGALRIMGIDPEERHVIDRVRSRFRRRDKEDR